MLSFKKAIFRILCLGALGLGVLYTSEDMAKRNFKKLLLY